ncbi:MAG: PQQ-binding-like beta-propeller repeat protein [Planctomycetia bacterium]|nr:PQQ-binding-like beta-propeller repeat protein [Planctomycetia bacterium]
MRIRHWLAAWCWWLLAAPGFAQELKTLWPQWRGPTRDGQVGGPAWPDNLEETTLRQLWRVELGPSYSGPVVAADRVFVTETRDRSAEVVRALDRKTGKELWKAEWQGALSVPFFAKSNGDWIRATPAYDGERLYVAGMRDVLVCLDARTGAERWKVDFVERYKTPVPAFGFVSSPLLDGEALYVQAGASVLRLNKQTGETVWRALQDEGGMMGSAFSSPVLTKLRGRTQLVVQTRTTLAGLDPENGKVLWSEKVPAYRGMNILTPTIFEEGIFTSTYQNRSFFFQVKEEQQQWTIATAWTHKLKGYMSSPVIIQGHAYLLLENQRLACLDLAKGQEKWVSDRVFGKYWSLAVQGERLLALDQRGTLYLLKANPEKFELLGSRRVSNEETWAHLAISGEELYVRELNGLSAFRWKQAAPDVPK